MSSSVGTPDTTWTETLGGLENGSGGSVVVDRPGYQSSWNSSPYRSIPDVAINAVHYSVYQSLPKKGFESVSGTSLGTPVWAGLIAEIDQARSTDGKSDLASTGLLDGIYLAGQGTEPQRGVIDPAYFSDVVYGGTSGGGCSAKKGFDQVTGLGTPDASDLVEYLGYDA
jgi:kumamolisin